MSYFFLLAIVFYLHKLTSLETPLLLFFEKYLSIIISTSFNHTCLCSKSLVTIIRNILLSNCFTPQKSKIQFFQIVSSGSLNILFSLSSLVFDVLNTNPIFALSNPMGVPSPLSPSSNSYAIPGLITLSIHPFIIAGGCPHQLG